MKETEKGVLDIQMLGGFTLSYEGKEIVLGRSITAKFVQLLQIVWLQGKKGIAKEQLMKSLYDRESLTNLNNSFNNLIYQMRRQMQRAGLPVGDYIVHQGGIYTADETVPVHIDALEFETLSLEAEEESNEIEKYRLYSQAFELYQGELLPGISTEIWVTAESLYYKELFERCVLWLGEYAKHRKDYQTMVRVYSRAAEIYPFDEWQVYQIDGLLCKGEYKEAHILYDKTVRLYSDEMGLPPSEQMMRCYEQMSEKITRCPGEISEIQMELRENGSSQPEGVRAYYCSYPSFIDAYRLLSRNMERTGKSMFLMLCTLVDYEGKMIQNQEKLKTRSEALKEAIGVSLRQGDAFTQYSVSQYLVLLVGTNQEDCDIIYRRISRKLKELAGPRAEFNYNVTSLAHLAESEEAC